MESPRSSARFDPQTHSYLLGTRRVPGINEALELAGLKPPVPDCAVDKFRYAGERGKAVHSMRHLSDIGKAQEYDFDANLQGYLDAWNQFRNDYRYDPEISEVPMIHKVYLFGGTADSAGSCGRLGTYAIVEVKTCAVLEDWIGLQLAAQELLLRQEVNKSDGMAIMRVAVQLFGNGKYLTKMYTDRQDRNVFLAAVAVANWKQGRMI